MGADISMLKDLRILYVEDDEFSRNNMIFLLNMIFKEVLCAGDGEEGLELFSSNYNDGKQIDIILSDINMPKMNGIDMIKNIRELDNNIPVIFLTAYSDSNYLLDAIKLHVSEYIIKPMTNNILLQKLNSAYLPIYQNQLLVAKNKELEQLNKKIKEVAKNELEKIRSISFGLVEEDTLYFDNLLDNITLDE